MKLIATRANNVGDARSSTYEEGDAHLTDAIMDVLREPAVGGKNDLVLALAWVNDNGDVQSVTYKEG